MTLNLVLQIVSYHFAQKALLVGTLTALCSALLGVSLVLKRYSMIGDGLSHVGFGALCVAAVLNLAPLKVAVPVVIVSAFLLLRISENSKIKNIQSDVTVNESCGLGHMYNPAYS